MTAKDGFDPCLKKCSVGRTVPNYAVPAVGIFPFDLIRFILMETN